MGLKVIEAEEDIVKPKIYFVSESLGFDGFPGFNNTAEEDADILIKAESIKSNRSRYNAAKKIIKKRGL